MSGEIQKVAYNPATTQMGSIPFTQGKLGHVYSPWFTYDHRDEVVDGKMVYGWGRGKYEKVMAAAKSAFAEVLGISDDEVIASVKPIVEGEEFEWRLGTMGPCDLPKPKKPALPEPIKKKMRRLRAPKKAKDVVIDV